MPDVSPQSDELIDLYNQDATPRGQSCSKAEAHRLGYWHVSAHIWIVADNGDILLQLRSHQKPSYPGVWDVSAAGHIAAGETVLSGAIRETREELGLAPAPQQLEYIGAFQAQYHDPKNQWYDNEIHHIYTWIHTCDIASMRLQKSEVERVRWWEFAQLQEEVATKPEKFSPHPPAYWEMIFNWRKNYFP